MNRNRRRRLKLVSTPAVPVRVVSYYMRYVLVIGIFFRGVVYGAVLARLCEGRVDMFQNIFSLLFCLLCIAYLRSTIDKVPCMLEIVMGIRMVR